MIKSVLCAADIGHGDDDMEVIRQASRMAEAEGAQLDVVTVVPDFGMSAVGSFFSSDHHDKLVKESKVALNDLVEKTIGADKNANVRHVVATGRVYEEVLKTASATDASLIVVGAHKADLADYLLGPNAARIVRHSKCSVFVVR